MYRKQTRASLEGADCVTHYDLKKAHRDADGLQNFRGRLFGLFQPFGDEVGHLLAGERVPDAVARQEDESVLLGVKVQRTDVRDRGDHLLLEFRETKTG